MAEIGSTKSLLKREFNTKELEEAKKILGMEIVRDQSRKVLRVSQSGLPVFKKSLTVANDVKHAYFKKRQESGRKDVEYNQEMAVFDWNDVYANPSRNMQRTWVERCETQRRKNKEMRDREMHLSLQQNLMEHIWQQVDHEDEDEDF
ncbi:hypothetical protein Tco_1241855 [Tanacetum coccineum]